MDKRRYSLDQAGLDAMHADVILMCDNCRQFNADEASEDLRKDADAMQEYAQTLFSDTKTQFGRLMYPVRAGLQ